MSNDNINQANTSNGEGDDTMVSFTNLGGDGLDTETMDLFGSFTNEAGTNAAMGGLGDLGGLGTNGFGQFSANDLSGFGVDLNTFDLGSGAGDGTSGMDLSSIQLMNLDHPSLNPVDIGANQLATSTSDAAQMMARLLGPGAQLPGSTSATTGSQSNLVTASAPPNNAAAGSIPGTSGANPLLAFVDVSNTSGGLTAPIMQAIQQTTGAPAIGETSGLAAVSQGAAQPPTATPRNPGTGNRKQKSRSTSLSSDDMGDIPLAQLTLMQSGQQTASDGVPTQPTSAVFNGIPPIQGIGMAGQLQMTPHGQVVPGQQTMAAIGAASLGMSISGDPGIQSSVLGTPGAGGELFNPAVQGGRVNIDPLAQGLSQLPMNQMPPQAMFQQIGQLGDLQSQQIRGAGMTSAQVALSGPSFGASGATNTPAPESEEARGVESTVLVTSKGSSGSAAQPANPKLKIELTRPATNTEETPLDQLEEIEDQLWGLLNTASKITRIMTGPSGGEQLGFGMDVGNTKIKAMVKEFMQSVVQIQAALQFQHKRLVSRGIPIEAAVGFQSDVAGFERDLVSWSDAARLLSHALNSAIEFSS
ncbi:hypothetical protein EV175_004100 [Coemansia sp. RSA 1933]|nr:hypothetical protein EV175_004100 [Coemansia sp. RSA 1933]